MKKNIEFLAGIFILLVIALVAKYLGVLVPIVGGPVFGILLGMILAFWKRPQFFNTGIKFTSKYLLQTAIVLIGFEMNLYNVIRVGSHSLLVMVFTITAAFLTAYLVGRRMNVPRDTSILIGVGTAICGGSAIAATAPIIKAKDKDVAYSISTIFLFNVIAVFLFPLIGHLLKLTDTGFGLWAGTAINDTSSVVAAAFSWSDKAGNLATIVKLTRTLMIIPVTLGLAIITSNKAAEKSSFRFLKIFPWFVAGFVVASVFRTFLPLPDTLCSFLAQAGKFMIIMAMSAIGLNTNIKQLIGNGLKPIVLGLSCWVAVAVISLLVQFITAAI